MVWGYAFKVIPLFSRAKSINSLKIATFLAVVLFFNFSESTAAQQSQFVEQVQSLLETDVRIKAAKDTVASLQEGRLVARKAWYPDISVVATRARESRDSFPSSGDSHLNSKELTLTATQPVYDFGARSAKSKIAELQLLNAKINLKLTKQTLISEAIAAQSLLSTSYKQFNFAKTSVRNIKKQAKLEDVKVQKGAGLSTDVLQAKVQLAGAEGRLLAAQGALEIGKNRYTALFGNTLTNETLSAEILIPHFVIPKLIDDAIDAAVSNNFQLASLDLATKIAKETLRQTKSELLWPKFDLIGEKKYKDNVAGTLGSTRESTLKLQMNYNFNTGLTSIHNIASIAKAVSASQNQYYDAKRLIIEQVRNAYISYNLSKLTGVLLRKQADISASFLELARKERKLGKRSLIDVLSGETALINARSDAEAARNALVVSTFNVISIMGILTPDLIKLKGH